MTKVDEFAEKTGGASRNLPSNKDLMETTMFEVQEIDPVLIAVKRAIRQLGLSADGPLGQQILLLGDAFYGYRFTNRDVTAVWSATDQTLTVFNQHGKRLGSSILSTAKARMIEDEGTIRLSEPPEVRKAA